MSTHNIRLGSMLSFDDEKEKDIIEMIEKLNSSHKTGQFLSNLIRIAFDTPELLYKKDDGYEQSSLLNQLASMSLSEERHKFFNSVTKDINKMTSKIDSIYEMALKTYTLSLMGKHLGLSEKSDNLLLSTFILEKQLKELKDILGVDSLNQIYASDKKEDIHKTAENILEYIIESYDNIINQLKSNLFTNVNTVSQINNAPISQLVEPVQQVQQTVQPVQPVQQAETVQQVVQDDKDEVIDFGEADLSALSNFFSL